MGRKVFDLHPQIYPSLHPTQVLPLAVQVPNLANKDASDQRMYGLHILGEIKTESCEVGYQMEAQPMLMA
jgi:hypothetical protein